jgi:hypothetical protein
MKENAEAFWIIKLRNSHSCPLYSKAFISAKLI